MVTIRSSSASPGGHALHRAPETAICALLWECRLSRLSDPDQIRPILVVLAVPLKPFSAPSCWPAAETRLASFVKESDLTKTVATMRPGTLCRLESQS